LLPPPSPAAKNNFEPELTALDRLYLKTAKISTEIIVRLPYLDISALIGTDKTKLLVADKRSSNEALSDPTSIGALTCHSPDLAFSVCRLLFINRK
jgi:hypothetical protein